MRLTFGLAAVAAAFSIMTLAAPAEAQATRTWVSGVGDDVNPCSRTAPCKTFAGAISKTAAGGEISVLDPGGFGSVTITKSMSLIADGNQGSILGASTNGIIINAGSNDVVNLRGLTIEGAGTGLIGVRILAGGSVNIQNLVVRGFQGGAGVGIDVEPTTSTRVLVSNTVVDKNNAGIVVKPGAGGSADVLLDHVQVVQNSGAGITADSDRAKVQLNNSVVFANGVGLASANSGQIISFGNNAIASNGQNGAPTAKAALQ